MKSRYLRGDWVKRGQYSFQYKRVYPVDKVYVRLVDEKPGRKFVWPNGSNLGSFNFEKHLVALISWFLHITECIHTSHNKSYLLCAFIFSVSYRIFRCWEGRILGHCTCVGIREILRVLQLLCRLRANFLNFSWQ